MIPLWLRRVRAVVVLALLVVGAIGAETRWQERRAARHNPASQAEVERLPKGAPEQSVVHALGRPINVETLPRSGRRLLYYEVEGGAPGDRWQLVFDGGKLSARRRL